MATSAYRDTIVIVGGGVIGLDVALVLAQRGLGSHITVVAEHLPGDTSIDYTSPWAGANFSAISGDDENALRWDRLGYKHLNEMAQEFGEICFVKRTPSIEYWDEEVASAKLQSLSTYLDDFKTIPANQLPHGVSCGISYTTVTINAPKHIEYLYHRLKEEYGVVFVRRKLTSIQEGYLSCNTRVVFNCTGNASANLAGVRDSKCYPTRGQILLVKAPDVHCNIMRHGRDYVTYVIPRPFSKGNVIFGGYMQKGVSTSDTFAHETESILKRTNELSSEVKSSDPEILAVLAGFRPSREGGARVEAEKLTIGGEDRLLVHSYGAGGTGFQAGYGMALDAVASAESLIESISRSASRSKI